MQIYNTLSRKKEKIVLKKKLSFFVCGPTVYDYPHLGHAKTYTQFDAIVRYLRFKGFDVFYLQNITDIDDKIIARANTLKVTPRAIAEKFEEIYKEDMAALGNTAVTTYARATDFIPQIIKQVKTLLKRGHVYKISDGYYYDLSTFPMYGKLSGRTTLLENDAVSRIDENKEKRNRGDFCVWKFSKPGEPLWESSLGNGRPGWHIEDTAITEHFFGPQYDIHGGAVDLIFPHHEAEIAEMEAASGKSPLVRFWIHTAFLNIHKEKMSKSKGNFFTIREVIKEYPSVVLRFFFLSHHYRTTIDFTAKLLEQAKNSLDRIKDFIRSIDTSYNDAECESIISSFKLKFYASLDDDFNTPSAFALLFDCIKELNKQKKKGYRVVELMHELNTFLGFMTFDTGEISEEVKQLISEREDARNKKDFKRSDTLRLKLLEKGIVVEDTKEGMRWKKS